MDLSKAFGSIPYDLLIVKVHAYSFSKNSLVFFYPYLKRRKQNVRVNNTHSIFQILLQGSILGLILFNIYISSYELFNFTDNNNICAVENTIGLYTPNTIGFDTNHWLVSNGIINPNKFQTFFVMRSNKMKDSYPLNINQEVIPGLTLKTV